MTFFAPDLFRNFGLGFFAGAMILGAATVGDWGPHIESPAQASEVFEAPQADDIFVIEPLEISE